LYRCRRAVGSSRVHPRRGHLGWSEFGGSQSSEMSAQLQQDIVMDGEGLLLRPNKDIEGFGKIVSATVSATFCAEREDLGMSLT
jgi:hypothetical protein